MVAVSYFSLRDSCRCAANRLSLVHYTGRPNSDWWAETLRELTIATLACDQCCCRHTLARVEVIDLSWWWQPRTVLRYPCCELRAGYRFKRASVRAGPS